MAEEDLLAARNRKDVGLGKPLALKVGIEPTPTTYRDTDRLPPEDLRICAGLFPAVTRYLPPS